MDPMLRTDRLLLRSWRHSDRQPFAWLNADPQVMEFFPAPLTRGESDAFVDRIETGFAEHGFGVWAVEEISTGAFIGFAGLLHQTFEASFTPAFEIGYRFARHAWGQGYATEAAQEAVRFGFDSAGLGEIFDDRCGERPLSRRHAQAGHDPSLRRRLRPSTPPGPPPAPATRPILTDGRAVAWTAPSDNG